jgi:nitrite reductase/ring-hydroxylating ferredoxin subunit
MQFPKPELLHPYPNGWYVIERSDKLKKGAIIEKKFMGLDIVLFRLQDGKACASTAFCPHLGAHFAHGGSIEGNCIRCPFHSFEFDANGSCTKTGYSTKPPPKAKLQMYELREINDLIILWYHENNIKPDWEVPEVSFEGWGKIVTTDWKLRSHPQETTENSVDIGHFAVVHGYKEVEIINDPIVDGPILSAEYAMHRKAGFLGKKNELIRIEFEAKAFGLGYSFVETYIPKYGIKTRHFVLPTPIEGNFINLKIGMSLKHIDKPSKIHPLLSLIPTKLIEAFILNAAFRGYKHDVSQDFKIWENKIYITPPALAKGDGPVWQYREWAKQFYSKENALSTEVSMEETSNIL